MKRTKRRTAVLLGAAALLACGPAFAGSPQARLSMADPTETGTTHTVHSGSQGLKSGQTTQPVHHTLDGPLRSLTARRPQ